MKTLTSYIFFGVLCLSACIGPEQPVLDKKPDQIQIPDTASGPMHYYLNLQKREIVSSVSIYEWDLAFDCRANGFEIIVNSAKGMGVYNVGSTFFYEVYPELDYPFQYDNISNDLSKTAIGPWGDFSFANPQSFGWVYLVHRGFDINKQAIGLKKLRIKGSKAGVYSIEYSNLDNTELRFFKVKKDINSHFVYFNFDNSGQMVIVEPVMKEWDLLVTPYIDSNYHENSEQIKLNTLLSVYDGILINPLNHWVAIDSFHTYDEIDFRQFDFLNYTSALNFIGCHFYIWDLNNQKFITRQNRTYIIKDQRDFVYKLNFSEFKRNANNVISLSFKVKNL